MLKALIAAIFTGGVLYAARVLLLGRGFLPKQKFTPRAKVLLAAFVVSIFILFPLLQYYLFFADSD